MNIPKKFLLASMLLVCSAWTKAETVPGITLISSTGERKPIISGAKTNMTMPMKAITIMPVAMVRWAKLWHSRRRPAP